MSKREEIEIAAQEVRTAIERFRSLAIAHPEMAREEAESMIVAGTILEKSAINALRTRKAAA
jgi:hypothetical protein